MKNTGKIHYLKEGLVFENEDPPALWCKSHLDQILKHIRESQKLEFIITDPKYII